MRGNRKSNNQRVRDLRLSPRMRGNPERVWAAQDCRTSIPAYAGEPARRAAGRRASAVYPRVCGGTGIRRISGRQSPRLSPRMRGNHCSLPVVGTPRVYPRVCGGTGYWLYRHRATPRLSPRMRGNRVRAGGSASKRTSIPAYAGEPLGILIVTPRTIFAKGMAPRRCRHSSRCTPAVSTTAARLFGC